MEMLFVGGHADGKRMEVADRDAMLIVESVVFSEFAEKP